MAIKLGKVKWDEDDLHAINTLRQQVLTLDSQRCLGLIGAEEYQRALIDITSRVEALEAKYEIR